MPFTLNPLSGEFDYYKNGGTGPAGPGVPVGGTTGQVLAKIDATNYNTQWVTPSGSGTVTSVGLAAPTGFTVSGSPVTASGNLTFSFTAGYSLPTDASQTNWNTAFTQTRQWDGGTTGLVAATGRTSLGLGSLATLSALGSITSAGAIGSTANLPIITTTAGALTTGSFGTGANTFCVGNDSRLSDARTPTAHNQAWSTITSTPTTLTGYGITDAQPLDADLTSIAALTTTTYGRSQLALADAAADTAQLDLFSSTLKGLVPLSGGGTTNFLRADGTWATPAGGGGGSLTVQDEGTTLSTAVTTVNFTGAGVTATGTSTVTVNVPSGSASAGGSTTQVQYNNAGALAGAANVEIISDNLQLTAPGTAPGAADASSVVVYPVGLADRFMLAMRGPIGYASLLQPSIFSNNVMMWSPQSGTVGTGSSAFQTAWTSNGNCSTNTVVAGTKMNTTRRQNYANAATTTNQQLGPRMNTAAELCFHRGSLAGTGGFFYFCRFARNVFPAATMRVFSGLQGNSATASICISDAPAGPYCGLQHITTDPATGSGAWNFVTHDGTTRNALPINFTANFIDNILYDFMMYCQPNGSTIFFRLDDLTNGVTYTNSTGTNLPANTVMMSPQCQASNGTAHITANAVSLGLAKIYVEAEF